MPTARTTTQRQRASLRVPAAISPLQLLVLPERRTAAVVLGDGRSGTGARGARARTGVTAQTHQCSAAHYSVVGAPARMLLLRREKESFLKKRVKKKMKFPLTLLLLLLPPPYMKPANVRIYRAS